MTSPATVPARRCFKVTRNYGRRSPFRRPRPHVVEIVRYGIAVAANAAGLSLHEFGIEAERVRLVLSATDAELETFIEKLDEVVSAGSEGTNGFWRGGLAHEALPLEDDAAIVQACVDVIAPASVRSRQ